MSSIRGIARTAARHAGAAPLRPATAMTTSHNFSLSRCASSQAAPPARPTPSPSDSVFQDLEVESSFLTPPLPESAKVATPRERYQHRAEGATSGRLPGSRYQFHPPKYDRGPLHPIQSPPSSDPTARDFVPGPFHNNRLRQTFHSTIASDLMTLTYTHVPPGTEKAPTPQRLRSWDGSSPYHKNRPLRGPRGDTVLKPLEKPITFRNIPVIRSVTLASFMPLAPRDPDRMVVARMVTQAITGVVPEVTTIKHNVAQWQIIKGQKAGVKATLYGNAAYDFLDKCIHLVFPRIKDWEGVKGSTGDSAGNLSWGLTREDVALFPEIEANYSMYPGKMIPGYRIFVETTARSDRQARLLLSSLGVPFYGELRD
ncbi:54S ribosomal protein L7, mitochondrial [Sporothrix eucalyptigena]|uniref:54S ribosomal protein L7, mitochondrial n=1 Tax=Sporothrix eucalyptigena TaxID=1812306 RepID=A0ABP0C5T3_9PEZI